MVNYERCIAGVAIGAAAIVLIVKGEYSTASTLLVGMLAFFVGEKNGARSATQQ